MKHKQIAIVVCLACWPPVLETACAEVTSAAGDGFQTVNVQTTSADSATTHKCLVDGFANWYDASHSYSGKPENLSLDLERQCMYEQLPDGGFVRHMEIVFHQPGKTLRLSGGLGPLQEMGVSGALVFQLTEKDGQTEIKLTYTVTGHSGQQLDKIATAVDGVLAGQLERLKKYCDEQGD